MSAPAQARQNGQNSPLLSALETLKQATELKTSNQYSASAVRDARYAAWRVIIAETPLVEGVYLYYRRVIERLYGPRQVVQA